LEILQKWWIEKYKLPWNHDLFQNRTFFDLFVEFQLDIYAKNPLEAHRNADGHVQFKHTGDTLIDKWEEQIAQGGQPDFMEAFDEEAVAKLKRLRHAGERRTMGIGGSFKDVLEAVSNDAQRQGLSDPAECISLPRGVLPKKYQRSNFGDGS
jgi:hypothetical protein